MQIAGFKLLFYAGLAAGACSEPNEIKDIVDCQNTALATVQSSAAAVSFVAENLAPFARAACTISQSSGQPASPDEGDLRCFQVFDSGVITSFNLVEGINGDRIEVSQPLAPGDRDRVILADISTDLPATLGGALAGAFKPIDSGSPMTCGTCHRTVGHEPVEIDGNSTWVLAGIRLNSTVRGTLPKNGQVPPEKLDGVLGELAVRHGCVAQAVGVAITGLASMTELSETCRRIAAVVASKGRFQMDNPQNIPQMKVE